MLAVREGGTSVGAPAKVFLTPHILAVVLCSVCQWSPSYTVIWPDTCSKQLWLQEGNAVQKQKTQPMFVLEDLAAAHCLLQHPSFQTLLPVEEIQSFFLVLSTSYGPWMNHGSL